METNLLSLDEVLNLTEDIAAELFNRPTRYDHLGVTISSKPKKLKFKSIRSSDIHSLNLGRPNGHTQAEKEQLKTSFARGVQPWQELPMVSKNTSPELIDNGFTHDLRLGFGRRNAVGENGKDEYFFYEVDGTPTQLLDLQSFENTCKLLEVEFQTGEEGVENHLKNLIAAGSLSDDEEEIEKKLLQVWPGISNPSKGRILKKVVSQSTTPKRYRTYNQTDIITWIGQEASEPFNNISIGGAYDSERNMWGYSSVNIQDPYISAIKKYISSGKKSYVVLSCKSPTRNSDLQKKRQNLVTALQDFHKIFCDFFGVKDCPLIILGFAPQDTVNEDMRYLVNQYGKRLVISI